MIQSNLVLKNFVLTKTNLRFHDKDNYIAFIKGTNIGSNVALIGDQFNCLSNCENYAVLNENETEKNENYQTKYIDPLSADYDRLSYPLIFYNGNGGCGKFSSEEN